ncbi:uncharacterized protein [Nicotiana tomentosiformis]|uniref:uncharacterized protein n=1 Tax=Nicotiana tomentosiformis TaxID=4098 RepID=UPI00388CC0EA
MSTPPLLSKLKECKQLLIYLEVLEVAVSVVLVREEEGTQFPVYYVIKVRSGAETRYPHLKKLALALVVASRKLRPYFQCHPIAVVTTFPLRNVLHKPELSGHLAKWAVEVSEFDIEYKSRTPIKSQVLADFVDDFSPRLMPLAAKEAMLVSGTVSSIWILFMNGASNVKGSGLGIVLITPSGETLRQAIRTMPLTNNEAEYETLVTGLEQARGIGSEVIKIKCDSQLVLNQVYGIFDTKEERMQQYFNKVQVFLLRFKEWSIIQILREENMEANALANLGSSTEMKGADFEALIPVEVEKPTLRYSRTNNEANNEALLVKLDLLEEHRNLAYVKMMAQKQIMERYYNRIANLRYFKFRDLVLRKVTQSTREVNAGKLGPTWERPYWISAIAGKYLYQLENQDGIKLPSNWNVTQLKSLFPFIQFLSQLGFSGKVFHGAAM